LSLLRQVKAWTHDGIGNVINSVANALKVSIHDGSGNPLSSYYDPVTGEWVLNIHNSDVHKRIISRKFHRHTTPVTTIATTVTAQDTSITVTSSVGFAIGDYLHIENGVQELVHPQITLIVANVITLDKPLDNGFAVGTTVEKAIVDMSETGSLASPLSHKVMPLAGEIWHITKISIAMAHSSAGDLGLFGNLTALTNGMVVRRYDGLTGTYGSLTIWKTNGDIDNDTGNIKFLPRSGGGSHGTSATGRLEQDAKAIAYLNGDNGDFLEILNQDDLITLGFVSVKAYGHFE